MVELSGVTAGLSHSRAFSLRAAVDFSEELIGKNPAFLWISE